MQTLIKKTMAFIQGMLVMALLCSIALNVWLWRASSDGMGYTLEQRAQMDELVHALDREKTK